MANLIGTAANQVPVNGMLGTAAFVGAEQLQAVLVSGDNLKTVNGKTLLGSGDLIIAGNDAFNFSQGVI